MQSISYITITLTTTQPAMLIYDTEYHGLWIKITYTKNGYWDWLNWYTMLSCFSVSCMIIVVYMYSNVVGSWLAFQKESWGHKLITYLDDSNQIYLTLYAYTFFIPIHNGLGKCWEAYIIRFYHVLSTWIIYTDKYNTSTHVQIPRLSF